MLGDSVKLIEALRVLNGVGMFLLLQHLTDVVLGQEIQRLRSSVTTYRWKSKQTVVVMRDVDPVGIQQLGNGSLRNKFVVA